MEKEDMQMGLELIETFIKQNKLNRKMPLATLKEWVRLSSTDDEQIFIRKVLQAVAPKNDNSVQETIDICTLAWRIFPRSCLGGKTLLDVENYAIPIPNTEPVSSPFMALYDKDFGFDVVEKIEFVPEVDMFNHYDDMADNSYLRDEELSFVDFSNNTLDAYFEFLKKKKTSASTLTRKITVAREYLNACSLQGYESYDDVDLYFAMHVFIVDWVSSKQPRFISTKKVLRSLLTDFIDFVDQERITWNRPPEQSEEKKSNEIHL